MHPSGSVGRAAGGLDWTGSQPGLETARPDATATATANMPRSNGKIVGKAGSGRFIPGGKFQRPALRPLNSLWLCEPVSRARTGCGEGINEARRFILFDPSILVKVFRIIFLAVSH